MKKLLVFLALLIASFGPVHAQTVQAKKTVNGSVAIVTGNTFQTILAAVSGSAGRQSLTIQNNNATDSCWLSFGIFGGVTITAGNATKARSVLLLPGGSYTRYYPFVPSDEIEATCTTSATDTLYVDSQ
jgi:hypothetical protein